MRISDWSSDVCSSDLEWFRARRVRGAVIDGATRDAATIVRMRFPTFVRYRTPQDSVPRWRDRKSVVEGKSVSVRVDLGGRRIIKKKNIFTHMCRMNYVKSHRDINSYTNICKPT